MFALDTNTVIHFFKGAGNVASAVLARPPHEIAQPAPVLLEVEIGILGSANPARKREQFSEFLGSVTILPLDKYAAEVAARVRMQLEKTGRGIGPMDTLIAGVALAHSATLVTHNTKEFGRVKGLRIEDWY